MTEDKKIYDECYNCKDPLSEHVITKKYTYCTNRYYDSHGNTSCKCDKFISTNEINEEKDRKEYQRLKKKYEKE